MFLQGELLHDILNLAVARLDTLRIAPSAAETVRNAIVATSRRLYGSRAPLIEALEACLGTGMTIRRSAGTAATIANFTDKPSLRTVLFLETLPVVNLLLTFP